MTGNKSTCPIWDTPAEEFPSESDEAWMSRELESRNAPESAIRVAHYA